MRITTPSKSPAGREQVSRRAGRGEVRPLLNEFKDQLGTQGEKLTTKALQSLVDGELNYKLVRRRRSEA
jgi:hypothetical protein